MTTWQVRSSLRRLKSQDVGISLKRIYVGTDDFHLGSAPHGDIRRINAALIVGSGDSTHDRHADA